MFGVINRKIVCCTISISPSHCSASRLKRNLIQNQDILADYSSVPPSFIYCQNLERGVDFLRDPHLNKGLAFTYKERQMLGIQGLLAASSKSQAEQVTMCKIGIERYKKPLNKYLFLTDLHDNNERLFYSLIATDVEKYLPIVYTPTVGEACQKYGFMYNNRPKGLFVTIRDKGHIFTILRNWPMHDVRVIVVTDGERILGLGDLGAFGMGIPIGKLCLYTALAGVKPHKCLPIMLDVGCNTERLLVDPMYIGLRQKRKQGKEYDEFMDEFMNACVRRFGQHVLIQFEDFAVHNAMRFLNKYKDSYCTFNDDIQGTASIVAAGVMAACKHSNKKISDHTFLFLGAGSAAVGIADMLVESIMEENIPVEEARKLVYMFDIDGLVSKGRPKGDNLLAKNYSHNIEYISNFSEAVTKLKPTCLIGVSTVGGAFTPEIIKSVSKNTDRPIILALSNPTSKAECSAQQAYDNTEGRCFFASGSPFPPVKYDGKEYTTGQGNNSFIFPGVGLAVVSASISRLTNKVFLLAAKTVASMVTEKDIEVGRIFPPLKHINNVSYKIAKAVAAQSFENGTAGIAKPKDLDKLLLGNIYDLTYPSYIPEYNENDEPMTYKPSSVEPFDPKLNVRKLTGQPS